MPDKLRVTLVKSPVSHTARTRGTVRALGLHRIGETVEINDTPEMRGMTRAVAFLLKTEPVGAAGDERAADTRPASRRTAKPDAGDSPAESESTEEAST